MVAMTALDLSRRRGPVLNHLARLESWYDLTMTLTPLLVTLRLNSGSQTSSPISCVPHEYNLDMETKLGDKWAGHIQSLRINFQTYLLNMNHGTNQSGTVPHHMVNVLFDSGDLTEISRPIDNEALYLPCFSNSERWTLELTVNPVSRCGVLVFIPSRVSTSVSSYILLTLQDNQLTLRLRTEVIVRETRVPCDRSNDWLLITMDRTEDTYGISVNGRPRTEIFSSTTLNSEETRVNIACSGNMIVGAVPRSYKAQLSLDLSNDQILLPLKGTLASIVLNNRSIDLLGVLSQKQTAPYQYSGYATSSASKYTELSIVQGSPLVLNCPTTRPLSAHTDQHLAHAEWLLMDMPIFNNTSTLCNITENNLMTSLRCTSRTKFDLTGFYSCYRGPGFDSPSVVFSYGVYVHDENLDSLQSFTHTPLSLLLAVLVTLCVWLLVELIVDLSRGYGLFRADLLPEESARLLHDYMKSEEVARLKKVT
uniref:Laminin G domain-containing protein n=1 Tax=Cacopsylla melanoneura TaxID=428564 RepID=A0A8D9BDC5_9HEMI